MPRPPAKMVPREVGGDGEEPGGKFFAGPEAGASPKDADEGFLRQVAGIILVADHAAEKMEDRCRVTLHQIVERRVATGDQLLHVRPVTGVGIRGGDAHGLRIRTWIVRSVRENRG
jgi:hypothetical protein